jgi:hypothetical protein
MSDLLEYDPESDPRKPMVRLYRWRWFKRVGASVLVSLVCYFGWVFLDREWTRRDGERELATVRGDIESSDPDWNWDQLNAARKRPPEGKNGAELIPRIKKQMTSQWGKEFSKDEWKADLDVQPNIRYGPHVIAQVHAELGASPDAVSLARTLRECPFGHRDIQLAPNVVGTLLQDTQDTRAVVDLLRWDVVLAVEEGNPARATEDLHALLNASRSIGDEPFLVSQLVRMAGRTVTVQSVERLLGQMPDTPDLATLQTALAADAEEPLLLYGLRGDRAAFDRLFENLQSGATSFAEVSESGSRNWQERLGMWHYRAYLPADRATALHWISKYIEVARHPIEEQPTLLTAIPPPPRSERHLLSGLLLPAVDRVAQTYWRTTALERCAVLGIACERFRQQHKRWPDSTNELVPAFVPAILIDPFDGQPLRYAKSETGVVFYSVGKQPTNLQGERAVPLGLPPGIELGFRLWNADLRRLPPSPDPPGLIDDQVP